MSQTTSSNFRQQFANQENTFEAHDYSAQLAKQEEINNQLLLKIIRQEETIAEQEETIALLEESITQYQEKQISQLQGELEKKDQIIAELQAQIKLQQDTLFGRSSEQSKSSPEKDKSQPKKGSSKNEKKETEKGGRRKRRSHKELPLIDEIIDLSEDEKKCPCCGLPFHVLGDVEEGETIEIEVRGYRRRVRRKSYVRRCKCPNGGSKIITAPTPGKIISKGSIGTSVWIKFLLDKFLFYIPTYRTLDQLRLEGIDLAQSTINDGMHKIKSLLEPIYEAICKKNQTEEQWNADETGWLVFEKIEGKDSTRWYIWVFKAAKTVVYKLSSCRAASTVAEHLGNADGTISCDRYSAYKKHVEDTEGNVSLSFCWSHVRRDYIRIGKSYPEYESWADQVVEVEIRLLYKIYNERKAIYQEQGENSEEFKEIQKKFSLEMDNFYKRRTAELENPQIPECKKKANESLVAHWHGLTEVVANPKLDMDNNAAERALRGPVIGRKNFWGSVMEWSGLLAVMLFTIFQTILLWGISPKKWLEFYFADCAANKGKAPLNIEKYLPWNMSEETIRIISALDSNANPPP